MLTADPDDSAAIDTTDTRGRCRRQIRVIPATASARSVTCRLTSGPPVIASREDWMVATNDWISVSYVVVDWAMFNWSFASCNGRTATSYGSNTSKSPKLTPAPVPVAVHVYW